MVIEVYLSNLVEYVRWLRKGYAVYESLPNERKKEKKGEDRYNYRTASSGWFEDASKSLIIILIGLQFLITLSLSLSLSLEEEETISLI